MRFFGFLLIVLVFQSCQVVETIEIKEDGSGEMTILQQRDEQSIMNSNPEGYATEQFFVDNHYVLKDIMAKQAAVVKNMSTFEQNVYKKYENATVRMVQNSDTKEFYRKYHTSFKDINDLPDLYKAYEYYDNIVHNYALSAEEHYSDLQFFYDGKVFKRKASIISDVFYKKEMETLAQYEASWKGHTFVADYVLKYTFPKRIKTVSLANVIISEDKKSLEAKFSILEAKRNPEMTNFEVIFEE